MTPWFFDEVLLFSFLFFVAVQVFRVASVCLGSPPDTICWEYRDKDKNFHRMGPLTPQEFYKEHVKPLYNIQDKVRETFRPLASLVHTSYQSSLQVPAVPEHVPLSDGRCAS